MIIIWNVEMCLTIKELRLLEVLLKIPVTELFPYVRHPMQTLDHGCGPYVNLCIG